MRTSAFFSSLVNEEIFGALRKEIVGQDDTLKVFIYGITKNFFEVLETVVYGGETTPHLSNFLIQGPTGSGKTFMVHKVCDFLQIPLIKVDVSNITPAGYKGEEITRVLRDRIGKIGTISKETVQKYKTFRETLRKVYSLSKPEELYTIFKWGLIWVLFPQDKVPDLLRLSDVEKQVFFSVCEIFNLHLNKCLSTLNSSVKTTVVLLDEFDKIFSRDLQINEFYSKTQQQLLKIMEDPEILAAMLFRRSTKGGTVYPTFVLAGSFWDADEDNLIPEMKGRIDFKLRLNRLSKEDYIQIAKQKVDFKKFFISLFGSCEFVDLKVSDDFYDAIGELCKKLNMHEYLGARRVEHVLRILEVAFVKEFLSKTETVFLNAGFVRWAFECSDLEGESGVISIFGRLRKEESENLQNSINDLHFKLLLEKFSEIGEKSGNKLIIRVLSKYDVKKLFSRDSKGNLLILNLIERNRNIEALCIRITNVEIQKEFRSMKEKLFPEELSIFEKLVLEEFFESEEDEIRHKVAEAKTDEILNEFKDVDLWIIDDSEND